MTKTQMIISIAVMSAITIFIRFLPFVVFSSKQTPTVIEKLGKLLPFAVMGMLLVYCLKNVTFTSVSGFLPELIAGAVVVLSYIWKRKTLLSVIGGTVCYMLLVQFVFV